MEHSDSSTLAQVVSVTSISFVAVSIVGMIVNTLESLQYTVGVIRQDEVSYALCVLKNTEKRALGTLKELLRE